MSILSNLNPWNPPKPTYSSNPMQGLNNIISSYQAPAPVQQKQNGGWYNGVQYWAPGQGPSTNNTPSNPISGGSSGSSSPSYEDQLRSQQDAINSQIDADYGNALSMLSSSEQSLQNQATTASGQIDTGATAARNEITNTQAVGEQGVADTLTTAGTQAKTASMQARDLFRQTQQSNNAQLSALGISSSSVAEALAERLGVETARRIAGVSDNLNTIQLNAQKELGRIKTYYTGKLTDIDNQVRDQKATIQNSLMSGLSQIANSRYQAAADKSAARQNLLYQVTSSLASLAQQEQQFKQSLETWNAQKTAALTPIVSDPNYIAKLTQGYNTFSSAFNPTQFNTSMNVNASGNPSYQVTSIKSKNPYDPYTQTEQYKSWEAANSTTTDLSAPAW